MASDGTRRAASQRQSRDISGTIDLAAPGGFALLRRLDQQWELLSPARRNGVLRGLDLVVPPPAPGAPGPLLLPGGSIALREADGGLLVCDPQDALACDAATALRLRRTLARHPGSITISHVRHGREHGPELAAGVPEALVPQAATLAAAGALQGETGWAGPALVQWHGGGACGWPLASAPPLIVLLAGLLGQPPGAGLAVETWLAETIDAGFVLVSSALAEHMDVLLAPELSDALRYALTGLVTDGPGCLAARVAEAAGALPSVLLADPERRRGAPDGAAWAPLLPLLTDPLAPLAMLGLTGHDLAPRQMVAALRNVLQQRPARIAVTRDGTIRVLADLQAEAAVFALQTAAHGAVSLLLPPPVDGAVGLYALARDAGQATGAQVLAAAPCWGFLQRLDADGVGEAGNAAWFGMGPGLDDLDPVGLDDF